MNGISHLTFTLSRHVQCIHCKMPMRFDENNVNGSSILSHLRFCAELRKKVVGPENNSRDLKGRVRHTTKELNLPSAKEIVSFIQSQNLKCYHLEVGDTPQKCDSQFPVRIINLVKKCLV
jgi:hypothetical protein